jgi:hypothetical protein
VLEPGLDDLADRIRVDVHVVHARSPDDEHAVAEGAQELAVLVGLRVARLEEELDLERVLEAPALGVHPGSQRCARDRLGRRPGRHARRRQRCAVEGMEEALQEEKEPPATGVDDAGLLEDRQHLRGVVERVLRAPDDAAAALDQVLAVAVRCFCLLGRLTRDGEDRPLLRLHDGLVREVGAAAQPVRERSRIESVRIADGFGDAAEELRQDHAGVAACAHQRPARDRRARIGGTVQLADHGGERELEIRAGVPVRDGIHVEPVDLFLVERERFGESGDGGGEVAGRDARLRQSSRRLRVWVRGALAPQIRRPCYR